MRHAAGELADRLHFLRMPQQFFRLAAGFVLGLQLARAILDGVFQRFGECAQLRGGALLVGDVDADADDTNGLSRLVVKDKAPRQNPAQFVVVWPHDAKIELEFALFCRQGVLDRSAQPDLIFAMNGCDPAFITAIEFRKAIHCECARRQAHGASLDLPIDHADAADLFGKSQKLGTFAERECRG